MHRCDLRYAACLACALALAACGTPSPPAAENPGPAGTEVERQATQHIDRMRTILPRADVAQATRYSSILKDAWKYFDANPVSIAVIRRSLQRELTQPRRNDFILLDLGYYLHERGAPSDKDLARNALYALDPNAEIIRFNQQELFHFALAAAAGRDARFLAFADRAFLQESILVGYPEARLTLDAATVCGFVYGAYGEGAEAHLHDKLITPVQEKDRAFTRKVLEVLIWMGSPASNGNVRDVLAGASRDGDTFRRATTFLMTAGGPQGRSIVLAVAPDSLDVWTAAYYERIRPSVRATTYKAIRDQLNGPPWAAILDSTKPRTELLAQVSSQRTQLFRGVPNPERIAELQRTNAALNALRYRDD